MSLYSMQSAWGGLLWAIKIEGSPSRSNRRR
jgi:hypothetical protein